VNRLPVVIERRGTFGEKTMTIGRLSKDKKRTPGDGQKPCPTSHADPHSSTGDAASRGS